MTWEVVIGLETHVELSTKTKLFCGCATTFGASPNTQCCPVCTGMPGSLPVLNRRVVDYALRLALALNCAVTPCQRFDRKNYFYPDLPKGYQISQLYLPMGRNGCLTLDNGKRVGIHELHMEEDAGKLSHESRHTRIDYNRSGVPLIEIVTEPDLRSGEEAVAYLEQLKQTLEYLEVSDCKMQEGSLRCDVNLSVRPVGSDTLGVRTELKNLGSLRAVARAVDYEARRQIGLLERGGQVVQETRRWDEEKNISVSLRSKEDARDYRYFPEPNLPPLVITGDWLERIRCDLPESAGTKRQRYTEQYGLSSYDARILTSQKGLASFFEAGVALNAPPKELANWIMGEVLRKLKEQGLEGKDMPLTAPTLVKLIAMVGEKRINRNTAVTVFDAIFDTNADPEDYVRCHGLEQVSDEGMVASAVAQVLEQNPKSVAEYRAGKEKVFDHLVGQTMRALRGKAAPNLVRRILREQLQ